MSWAKLDDRFHSHPKVRGAWYRCPASLGLHVLAITFAADHETDGVVPSWFVAGAFARPREMEAATAALVESGMWEEHPDGFLIHDFLDYHESRAERAERRASDARRKREERRAA